MSDPSDLFKKLVRNHSDTQLSKPLETSESAREPSRRGRPATGKRSDPNWIGRTYYIRKETDLDIESELLLLKRQGFELDKSELVDALLTAWLKWQQGENSDSLLFEISPRRISDNRE